MATALRRPRGLVVGTAVGALAVAVFVGVVAGTSGIAPGRVLYEVLDRLTPGHLHTGLTLSERNIVWQLRMPRVVLAGLVGAMLSLAGASYQGVFRNPLVDPYLLGSAAGAGLGATIAIAFLRSARHSWPVDPIVALGFAGAILAVATTYFVGAAGGTRTTTSLVLAGVAVTSFATAVQTFLQRQDDDTRREVFSWILGRLNTATWGDVRLVAPYIVVSSVVLLMYRRQLDVLRVGEDEADALGAQVARTRVWVVAAATLGTAAAVSVSGLISFVGIIVPHTVRLLGGSSFRRVLPLSLLVGAAFLILTDTFARTAAGGDNIPIGVVTAFFGAPFFIVLMRTRSVTR
jgi:iron complex transport system permease protein